MNGGSLLAPAHLARGTEALGDGRHDDAFYHLWPVFDEKTGAFHRFMRWHAVLDLVEAGKWSGHNEQVAEVTAELKSVNERCVPPILSAGLACSAPLLADDHDAEALFIHALKTDLGGYPFLRARTLYSFGRWLRRQRRNVDSRAPLRDAVELFDRLGATRWSGNARQELRATGEILGRRSPDARDRLTAQELQISAPRSPGVVQPRDWRAHVPFPQDSRLTSLPDFSQARNHVPSATARRAHRTGHGLNCKFEEPARDVPTERLRLCGFTERPMLIECRTPSRQALVRSDAVGSACAPMPRGVRAASSDRIAAKVCRARVATWRLN